MANEIALVGGAISVPDYIRNATQEDTPNVIVREGVPSLTFTGKIWTINANGEKTKLMRTVDDEEVPVAVLPCVILDYAKSRGRSYYEGNYDPDNTSAPKCWSTDGVSPDDAVPEPVNPKCAGCPMSVKGSRVTDNGKATVACSQHRILAIVPVKAMHLPPLRLKLAITSDYDGQSKELAAAGKFAFTNYLDFINGKGITHTYTIVTNLTFDPNTAYPKLMFTPKRWLEPDELARVKELRNDPGMDLILGTTADATGSDQRRLPGKTQDQVERNKGEDAAASAARLKAEADAKEKADADAKKAEKAAKAKAKAEADAKAKPPADEDDEADLNVSAAPAPKKTDKKSGDKAPTSAPPTATEAVVPDDVADMLNSWGDD